jgi:hypothetical protein
VFEIEDLLLTAIATRVDGDPLAVVPELDLRRRDADFDQRARLQRH